MAAKLMKISKPGNCRAPGRKFLLCFSVAAAAGGVRVFPIRIFESLKK
jgi:hypothetical protein